MPPNILLFLTDDHGAWATGCGGNSEVQSPVLDQLAAEGALFPNAFTPCPVCSPARACLLTGRTPSQVGIHDWIQEGVPEIDAVDRIAGEITLPEVLKAAGYACGLSGKWHLGRSRKTPRGFDSMFGLQGGQGVHEGSYCYRDNDEDAVLTGNKTRIITDHALDFLDKDPRDRPFFLNVGYIATHSPYEASAHDPELAKAYEDATFRDIPAYAPHPWRRQEGFPMDDWTAEECRERYAGYYAAVTEIDRAVGRILERLREQGRLDETLVIYTSDHGAALGHNGIWGKGNSTRPLNMYETGLRVPLILRWPERIAANTRVEACVDHYDTFLSVCEFAKGGVDGARNYPGRSYASLLSDSRSAEWDDTRYGEFGDLRMIRTPEWKLIKRYGHGPDELFDLQRDPGERENIADAWEHAETVRILGDRLERFYAGHEVPERSGMIAAQYAPVNRSSALHDGIREKIFPAGRR